MFDNSDSSQLHASKPESPSFCIININSFVSAISYYFTLYIFATLFHFLRGEDCGVSTRDYIVGGADGSLIGVVNYLSKFSFCFANAILEVGATLFEFIFEIDVYEACKLPIILCIFYC